MLCRMKMTDGDGAARHCTEVDVFSTSVNNTAGLNKFSLCPVWNREMI